MKAIIPAFAAALLAGGAACAQPAPAAHTAPVCLQTFLIDHTHTVDPNTIIFHMKNGDEWKNTLTTPCNGLMFHGFIFETHTDSICDNMQAIEVLKTHQVCLLGAFTRYTEPPKPPSP